MEKTVADNALTLKDRSADLKPGGRLVAVRRDDESSERISGPIMQKKGKKSMRMTQTSVTLIIVRH